jgi:hypothetical protein
MRRKRIAHGRYCTEMSVQMVQREKEVWRPSGGEEVGREEVGREVFRTGEKVED